MSKQTDFIVAKGDEQLGPMSIAQVAGEIAAGNIAVTDFVYDLAKNDWVTLFECEALKTHLAASKPKAPPKPAQQAKTATQTETKSETKNRTETAAVTDTATELVDTGTTSGAQEWFVQKGQHRYGPFSYLQVLKGLQEKTIYEFDLISKDTEQWYRIAELEEFSADNVRSLQETAESVFTTRQFPRVQVDVEVIVHDNSKVWMGRAFEASAGGTGLIIENSTLVPGQTLLLHFAGQEGLPAFNALCEIVGKKFSKEVRNESSPVQYAVRFLKLDSKVEKAVQSYFQTGKKSRAA
jgi:hypothetical protein